jgi:glycosyltransferase involved in cell wall biosynthesis
MANEPENMIYCGMKLDIRSYIAKADYLVQLSGSEAFSYSLLESLECCTPVIVTPLPQNAEMGIVDGYNGYIVPLNVESFDVKKILNVPKFDFKHDNDAIIERWRKLLGNTKPTRDYQPDKLVEVEVISKYRDIQRDQHMEVGFRCGMRMLRALELQGLGFVRILK